MLTRLEFIGLPGSGKTTMYRALAPRLKGQGLSAVGFYEGINVAIHRQIVRKEQGIRRAVKRLLYELGKQMFPPVYRFSNYQVQSFNEFMLANAKLTTLIIKTVNAQPVPAQEKAQVMNWVFRDYSGYKLMEKMLSEPEIAIFDGGLCHLALSIWGRGEDWVLKKAGLKEYLELIPLPSAVVFVNIGAEICEHRLATRGYPALLGQEDYAKRKQKYELLQGMNEYILSYLKEKGVAIIDSGAYSQDLELISKELIETMKTKLTRDERSY